MYSRDDTWNHFVPRLCWNNIDSQGAECLAAALTGNCSLTSLEFVSILSYASLVGLID